MSCFGKGSLGRFLRDVGSSGLPDLLLQCGVPLTRPSLCLHGTLFIHPPPRPLRGLGYKEEEFSWSQYLRSTRAQAAPKHVFVNQSHVSPQSQSGHPPQGEPLQPAQVSDSSEESSSTGALCPLPVSSQMGGTHWAGHGQRGKPAVGSPPFPSTEILSSTCPVGVSGPPAQPGLSDVFVLVSCFGLLCSSWCEVQAPIYSGSCFFLPFARHRGSAV